MINKILKRKLIQQKKIHTNNVLQHVAIKNPLAVPRAAVAPPRIAPGVQMVKKEVTPFLTS